MHFFNLRLRFHHTQRIENDIQIIQNKLLKQIKYFAPGNTSNQIHKQFKLDSIKERMEKLLTKFLTTRLYHEMIAPEFEKYERLKDNSREAKYETLFDAYDKLVFLELQIISQLKFENNTIV